MQQLAKLLHKRSDKKKPYFGKIKYQDHTYALQISGDVCAFAVVDWRIEDRPIEELLGERITASAYNLDNAFTAASLKEKKEGLL